jgi:hypothetical protein
MPFAATKSLNIAFETGGPLGGTPVLLLHVDLTTSAPMIG